MPKAIFAYWDTRGIGEPIRMMLEHAGVQYEDKRFVCGDGPDYDDSCWTEVKEKLDLDFPNLPYFVDGDLLLTESWAIMKHLARQHDLTPSATPQHCDVTEGVVSDLRKQFTAICYSPDFRVKSADFFERQLPAKLDRYEAHLSKQAWLGGDRLTYVDFAFCEILDHLRMANAACLSRHPLITAYLDKFFAQDRIAAYRKTDRYNSTPVHNKSAHWGSTA